MPAQALPDLLVLCLALFAAAALAGAWPQHPAVLAGRTLEALGLVLAGGLGLASLAGHTATVTYGEVWGRWRLALGLSPLGGFFLVVLALVSLAAWLYAPRYTAGYKAAERARMRILMPLFILSMAVVVLAQDAVTFLAAWEGMSLASLGLVLTEHRHGPVRRAGFVYFVATHVGAIALVALFGLLVAHGLGIEFRSYASHAPQLGVATRSALLALALLGFGSKAALVPMHVWLPRAHPVAPSQVSALMSGVMVKVALYGLMLALFAWLGVGPLWWGGVLVVLATAAALMGVLYALMEHGLKTLLAYHTIENVGIIMLGVGGAELARSLGIPALADFALAAGLFHVLNHAVFKSGLFLTAGSVRHGVGSDDLERLGGLARRMPYTTAAFIVLSVAISGLPPFNGFASEWMVLESLLRLSHAGPAAASLGLLGALGLALAGGLAAACFVKASGVGFLGPPRSLEAARAREVPRAMAAAPIALATVSLALGLAPGFVAALGVRVARTLVGGPALTAAVGRSGAFALAAPWTHAQWPMLWLVGGGVLALILLVALKDAFGARARRAPAWACGHVLDSPHSAYSAMAFSKSIRQIFAPLYQPQRVLVRQDATLAYLHEGLRYENRIRHVIDRHLYAPLREHGLALARSLRRLQSGSLRGYVGYLLVTLLAALIIWGR